MDAARALLSHIVDYAGLFAPADLDMAPAVENYASYLAGEDEWMLARFVVPVARLDAFASAHGQAPSDHRWRLSALVGDDVWGDLEKVAVFNDTHSGAVIDAIELRAHDVASLESAAAHIPDSLQAYFEVPVKESPVELIEVIGMHEQRAKIRTGGVTADMFPSPDEVVRFIAACNKANVPFKATAGLHHAMRGKYHLTYEPSSAEATMFGFLNVFMAAILMRNGMDEAEAVELLKEDKGDNIRIDGDFAAWWDYSADVAAIEQARREFAIAFGSCSFVEPVEETKGMHAV